MGKLLSGILLSVTATFMATRLAPVVQTSDLTYEGHYDVQPYGNDSTYLQGFTSRRVGGQLRLYAEFRGDLFEFVLPAAFGGSTSGRTRFYAMPGNVLSNFNGFWFEESKQRLWVVSTVDYTNSFRAAHVSLVTLHDDATATLIGRWDIGAIPEKRVYGGCQPSPVTAGRYVCGWGGYTSLVAQAGGASMGPTMYEIPEPTSQPSGSVLPVTTILDTANSRGKRLSLPLNYFDGGDPRQNPPSRPTAPPLTTAAWLSPGADGLGWFVWGDSYYNTGVTLPDGRFLAVASLCQGSCWYQSSTLAFDGRQFELHVWDKGTLAPGQPLTRPTRMTPLNLPRGNTVVWGGNSAAGNIAGATYDATGGKVYLLGCPLGPNVNTCRVYQFGVSGAGQTPPPPPPPPTTVPPTQPPTTIPPTTVPPTTTIPPTPPPVPPPSPTLSGTVVSITRGQSCTGSWWRRVCTPTNEWTVSIKTTTEPSLTAGQAVRVVP